MHPAQIKTEEAVKKINSNVNRFIRSQDSVFLLARLFPPSLFVRCGFLGHRVIRERPSSSTIVLITSPMSERSSQSTAMRTNFDVSKIAHRR
jgi:hypothetical protein